MQFSHSSPSRRRSVPNLGGARFLIEFYGTARSLTPPRGYAGNTINDPARQRERDNKAQCVGTRRVNFQEWPLEINNRPFGKFGDGRGFNHPLIRRRRE